jgi:hypothetical protein
MTSLNDLAPNPTSPVVDRGFVALDDPRFREVHCSTIQVAAGVEYVTWFGGTKEGHPDIKIWWVHARPRRRPTTTQNPLVHVVS